jgi:hypothetical protein
MKQPPKTGNRIVNKSAGMCLQTGFLGALVCSWTVGLPTRISQAQVHENNKPMDMKQIERLERQLSEIRQRIDALRQINDPHTQNVTAHLARLTPTKHIVNLFIGNFYVKRGHKDDFHVGDRVLTICRVNGVKQITGFGVVVRLEDDEALFEELSGSGTHVEDEVYVINRDDTSASIINAIQF